MNQNAKNNKIRIEVGRIYRHSGSEFQKLLNPKLFRPYKQYHLKS